MLDTLASYARTALDDPNGLPPGELDTFDNVAYAIGKLDAIIEALNPALETTETFARTFTVLGRHLAERADYMRMTEWTDDSPNRFEPAANLVQDGLDRIDEAIALLKGEGEA